MKESPPPSDYCQLQNTVMQHKENPTSTGKSSSTESLGVEVQHEEWPFPPQVLKTVSSGHGIFSGGIIPSVWYGLVGSYCLKTMCAKVTLVCMCYTDFYEMKLIEDAWGDKTTLTFLTANASDKGQLIRAQVASSTKILTPVPQQDGSLSSRLLVDSRDRLYDDWCRPLGYNHMGAYRSIHQVEVIGDEDASITDNFLAGCALTAYGNVGLPVDDPPTNSLAKAFFVVGNAMLQSGIFYQYMQYLHPQNGILKCICHSIKWSLLSRRLGPILHFASVCRNAQKSN